MAYIDGLLGRDEQILYVARQHLFVLVSHVVTEMILIGLLVAAGVASNMAFAGTQVLFGSLNANNLILLICVSISVIVLISGFLDYLRWNAEQYVITDRRVIQVRGIINKTVLDSSLEKINDLELRQSLLGRMFNYGTIAILTGSGEDGTNILDRIAEPMEFKRAMLEAKHSYERGYDYAPPPPPAPRQHVRDNEMPAPQRSATRQPVSRSEIQRTLEELAALRDRGILSSDEFEQKKRELLSRI
jgi:uncharacterized membrane protein YdbT with pleckstrin-like domain